MPTKSATTDNSNDTKLEKKKEPPSRKFKRERVMFNSPDGKSFYKCYCRVCTEMKHNKFFYTATDTYLDKNGKMSICIDCIDDIYKKFYILENDISRALLKVCRLLNIAYMPRTVEVTIKYALGLVEKGKKIEDEKLFSYYKAKVAISIPREGLQESDNVFKEPVLTDIPEDVTRDAKFVADEIRKFWGEGFAYEEYEYLEDQFAEWEKTHTINTQSEKTLLKFICIKLLEIDKDRRAGNSSTSSKVKEFQDLLKTSALTPAMSNVANSGKSVDTFGAFIKQVEEFEPCEYYKDKELFKDFDNLESYIKKYITRPIKNFIVGSRDYNVSEDEVENDDDYDFSDEVSGDNDAS